jgi:hypothetical protein
MQGLAGKKYVIETETAEYNKVEAFILKVDMSLSDAARQVKRVEIEEMPSNTLAEKVKIGKEYVHVKSGWRGSLLAELPDEFCFSSQSQFLIVSKTSNLSEWLKIKEA